MVLVPATLAYLDLRSRFAPDEPVMIGSITAPYDAARRIAFQNPAMQASHEISALNMPAFFVEVLISLPTSWPETWKPHGMIPDVWRGFAFPFFALPAWWFVGRGFDALLLRKKPGRTATVIASILCIGFIVLFCGLGFALSPSERSEDTWPLWGLALWTVLFSAFPAAWIRSRRSRINVYESGQIDLHPGPRDRLVEITDGELEEGVRKLRTQSPIN